VAAGALDWEPQGTPTEGATVGCCGVDQELTACVATGTAAATDERSGPRIHPDGRITAPGVLASMGSGAPDGAPHPVAFEEGVVQLVATGEGWGEGLPHAAAGEGWGEGLGLPHAAEGAGEGAGATGSEGATATVGAGVGATTGVGAGAVARGWELLPVEVRRVVTRVGVPVIGIMGATAGSETGTTAAGKDGATGTMGATGSPTGATLSATARPPVRLPAECCEALPETERKPPLLATFQLKDSESRSPEMDPEPERSVKFIRMLRTESVKVQRWPDPKESPESPERLAVRVQCSPRSLVTWTLRSEREPWLISSRSRVVRSSVMAIGEVTDTVVLDDTVKLPAKGPGPRPCAAALLAKPTAASPMHACTHVLRLIVCMFPSQRGKIKRHSLTHRVAAS
jgi:hypothetical protein